MRRLDSLTLMEGMLKLKQVWMTIERRVMLCIVLGCLLFAGCSAGSSEPNVIVSGFAHATAAEHTEDIVDDTVVGGVFLSIENHSSFPVRLMSATTSAAGT